MKKLAYSIILLSIAFSACGGSDDFGSSRAFVTDVRVDPESVRVGQEIGVRVDFEPEEDFSSIQRTVVVVKIPAGVDYVDGSSDFDGSDVSGFRRRNPNRVEICSDDTRSLTYIFDEDELTDFENTIRFSARAFENVGTVSFSAEANDSVFDDCNIFEQDSDTIIVRN